MKSDPPKDEGFTRKDSVEHERYAKARSTGSQESGGKGRVYARDDTVSGEPYGTYERVKSNKGVPGIYGMIVEAALPCLKEQKYELLKNIRNGKYKPSPVRRKGSPKPDGGKRKLGVPNVIDRIIRQAIAQ